MPVTNQIDQSYLLPFLTTVEGGDRQWYDVDEWLGEWGQYMSVWDPTEEAIVAEQAALESSALSDKDKYIKDIQEGINLQGFSGGYAAQKGNQALARLQRDLQRNKLQAISTSKGFQRERETQLYDDLYMVANVGGFDIENLEEAGLLGGTDATNQMNQYFASVGHHTGPLTEADQGCPCPGGGWSIACCDPTTFASNFESFTPWDPLGEEAMRIYQNQFMSSLWNINPEQNWSGQWNEDFYNPEYNPYNQWWSYGNQFVGSDETEFLSGLSWQSDASHLYELYQEQYQGCLNSAPGSQAALDCYQLFWEGENYETLQTQMEDLVIDQWDEPPSTEVGYNACMPESNSFNAEMFFGGGCQSWFATMLYDEEGHDHYLRELEQQQINADLYDEWYSPGGGGGSSYGDYSDYSGGYGDYGDYTYEEDWSSTLESEIDWGYS